MDDEPTTERVPWSLCASFSSHGSHVEIEERVKWLYGDTMKVKEKSFKELRVPTSPFMSTCEPCELKDAESDDNLTPADPPPSAPTDWMDDQ